MSDHGVRQTNTHRPTISLPIKRLSRKKRLIMHLKSLLLSVLPTAALTLASSTNTAATTTCNSNDAPAMTKFRSVRKIMPRPPKHWVGDGFHVYPVFSNLAFTEELSP